MKKFVDQRGPKFPVVGDVDPCWVSFSVRESYTADHGRFASGTERVEPTDHLINCLHLSLLNLLDLVSDPVCYILICIFVWRDEHRERDIYFFL